MALAGALGLSGVILLFLARPAAPPVLDRASGEGFEIRQAAHDAQSIDPDDATTPISRLFAWPKSSQARFEPPSAPRASVVDQAPPLSDRPRADLVAALRAGGLTCLGESEARLSWTERELCREKLGALARKAEDLTTAIAPEKQTDYDAVARAQAPRRAIVPLKARGAGNLFSVDDRSRGGRGPRVGCAMRFGPNLDSTSGSPANALSAGSCFIRLPAGSPTPEIDARKTY